MGPLEEVADRGRGGQATVEPVEQFLDDPARFDEVTMAALDRAFPDAWVEVDDALSAEMDDALGDRHVLATAVAGAADVIGTANTAAESAASMTSSTSSTATRR